MPSSYLCNCYLQRLSFDDLFIKNVTWKFVIPNLKSFVWCNNWTETEWGSPQNQLTEISRICNFMQISLHWSNSLSLQVEQNYLMRSFWWWPMNQLGTFFTTATCHKILLVIITSCLLLFFTRKCFCHFCHFLQFFLEISDTGFSKGPALLWTQFREDKRSKSSRIWTYDL